MERARVMSKSMLSYLKRAKDQKEFLLKETKEFDRGKRHLANMMGIESAEMTQKDVDSAIKYLFPSGLFIQAARPMMKHPDILYETKKDAQFDKKGRPNHHLFYTTRPNYYETLSRIASAIRELNKYEDSKLRKGIITPTTEAQYYFSGRDWLSLDEMRSIFLEKIYDHEYKYLIESFDKLIHHPYSARARELIEKYSKTLPGKSLNLCLPELKRDEATGQVYAELVTKKKSVWLMVKTVLNGSGIVNIEGKDILYFETPHVRRAVLAPLVISGMIDKVDIFVGYHNVPEVIGESTVAIAIRQAVSLSIAAYVDEETRDRMRLAGLLTADSRRPERKKYGQKGARAKYTWKKR